jgi:hypothetical protein
MGRVGVRSPRGTMPWTDVVTAISTAFIAILLSLPAIASFLLFRELRKAVVALERFSDTIQQEVVPAIQSARGIVDQATQLAGNIKGEVDAIVDTSKDLRVRVRRAADAAEVRLSDLETLLDVVYEEVEETALDVASALRTTRKGAGIFASLKRALLRRGR